MREIKFRFEHLGELFEVIEINLKERKVLVNNGDWFSFDIGTLLQFTGLQDKNGKDIYEGDILQSYPTQDVRFVVGYGENEQSNSYGYNLQAVNTNITYEFDKNSVKRMEVIGNIYENSELLEGKEWDLKQ